MMETNKKVYWKEIFKLLEEGITPNIKEVDFNNEIISFKNAALFNRFGFLVPENLIEYNDDEIDFSDDPDMTEEEIATLTTSQKSSKITTSLSLGKDIKNWIKEENIDIDKFIITIDD